MIVDTIRRAGPFPTDGSETTFPFDFKVFEEVDVLVTSTSAGVATELVLDTHYTVSLNADQDSNPGGDVVFDTAPDGPSITLTSDLPIEQPTVFANTGGFYPRVLNDSLDRQTIYAQQFAEQLSRAALVPLDATDLVGNFARVAADGSVEYTEGPSFAALSAQVVGSVTDLAAIVGPVSGDTAFLTETGRVGVFVFSGADQSANVTIDVGKGIYVAPAAASTGASGAWVRKVCGADAYQASWFGLPTGASDTTIAKSIETLREEGRNVQFGAGTFKLSDIRVNKAGYWVGRGDATVLENNGAGVYNTFGVAASGRTGFLSLKFTNLSDADNADAQFHINVSPRVNVVTTPELLEDIEVGFCTFTSSDTGIRVSFGGTGTTNDVPGTTWWTPKRAWIHDCHFDDVLYQAIIPEGHDILVERCRFKLSVKPGGGYRPFSHFLRILGCNRVTIRDNYFECPYDYAVISTQLAAVDNGLSNVAIRAPRNVTIENNRFNGGFFLLYQGVDRLSIKSNWFWNNPSTTADTPPALFYLAFQQGQPIYLGNVEIHDNTGYGYPIQMLIENHSADKISYKRNEIYGNLKTGAAFDATPIKVSVNSGVFNQDGVTQIKPPMMLDIEGNGIYGNPSMIGSFIQVVGHTTGLHLRVAGNRTSERQGSGTTLISGSALSGTDFQISLGFGTAFDAWVTVSGATDLSDNAVGDNIAMPTGHYAAALAASKFRDEQYLSTVYPAVFA